MNPICGVQPDESDSPSPKSTWARQPTLPPKVAGELGTEMVLAPGSRVTSLVRVVKVPLNSTSIWTWTVPTVPMRGLTTTLKIGEKVGTTLAGVGSIWVIAMAVLSGAGSTTSSANGGGLVLIAVLML